LEGIRKINIRAFASISLFILIIILCSTAVGIQVIDAMIDPKLYIAMILNPDNQSSNFCRAPFWPGHSRVTLLPHFAGPKASRPDTGAQIPKL
jgi:hypothetical protein